MGASSNINLNCNLARFGVYMVKLCHEKMLILRCILLLKKLIHLQKMINPYPLIKLERPDKKLYSLGIILIPYENLKLLEKYQPSPLPQFFFNSIE